MNFNPNANAEEIAADINQNESLRIQALIKLSGEQLPSLAKMLATIDTGNDLKVRLDQIVKKNDDVSKQFDSEAARLLENYLSAQNACRDTTDELQALTEHNQVHREALAKLMQPEEQLSQEEIYQLQTATAKMVFASKKMLLISNPEFEKLCAAPLAKLALSKESQLTKEMLLTAVESQFTLLTQVQLAGLAIQRPDAFFPLFFEQFSENTAQDVSMLAGIFSQVQAVSESAASALSANANSYASHNQQHGAVLQQVAAPDRRKVSVIDDDESIGALQSPNAYFRAANKAGAGAEPDPAPDHSTNPDMF